MKKALYIIGSLLVIIIGIARGISGVGFAFYHASSSAELFAGIGMIVVSVILLATGIKYWINNSATQRKALTIATILFWADGIVNGFIIGTTQVSGPAFGTIYSLIILACIWAPRMFLKDEVSIK